VPRALVDPAHPAYDVLWSVRLPRLLAAGLVGASLALAGAVMQAIVRNPLADPGLMGVTAGAGVAGVLAIVLFPARPMLRPMFACAGAATALAVVLAGAATGVGRVEPLRLILTGVAVQAIAFAALALLMFFYADRAPAFVAFTIGSLNGAGWTQVRVVGVTATLGAVIGLLASRTLDLMLLDDDTAGSVGLSVPTARAAAAGVSAVLAAGAASTAGLVGFVGLVVPNLMRILVGPSHRTLLPLCLLGGAVLTVVADTAARIVMAPLELPVGALLALGGGPYFLLMLRRRIA
jgi:iron complex transport system permease protein